MTIPSATNRTRITFIGFGEVGRRFARDFLRRDGVEVTAYDILLEDPQSAESVIIPAREIGVSIATSASTAVADARLIFSAVTADATEAVAKSCAAFLKRGQIFVDLNSASPTTKQRAASYIAGSGAHYLEAAVMAPVLMPGAAVPILAGGPEAQRIASELNILGMNVTAVATDYGRASAMKLCRSIMIKGWEALLVDCAAAAREWGVEQEVFGSLNASYPSIDWAVLAEDMGERIRTHGRRRSAEMNEAAQMLADLGRNPSLSRAVADAHARGAAKRP